MRINLSERVINSIRGMQESPEDFRAAFLIIENYIIDKDLLNEDPICTLGALKQVLLIRSYVEDILDQT